MDSNDSHLTADDDIIVTKTIRSISGRVLISVLIWKCPILRSRDIDVCCMNSFLVSILDPGKRGLNLTSVFLHSRVSRVFVLPHPTQHNILQKESKILY